MGSRSENMLATVPGEASSVEVIQALAWPGRQARAVGRTVGQLTLRPALAALWTCVYSSARERADFRGAGDALSRGTGHDAGARSPSGR
jgi:hypothetical protein